MERCRGGGVGKFEVGESGYGVQVDSGDDPLRERAGSDFGTGSNRAVPGFDPSVPD